MDKECVKMWLKDKYNLSFALILLVGLSIRIYHFFITQGQPLWWDEADYMAYAKNLAGFNIGWIIAEHHNSLYPYMAGLIFKVGLGEVAIRLLLQVVPSILSVALVYFLANEMYNDKKVGIIASFLMSVFLISLFNTSRFHVDIPGLFFGLMALYVFWKGFEKKEKIIGRISPTWAIPLTALFAVLAYSIRRGYFLFGVFIAVYVLLTRNWKDLAKDKYNWVGLALGIILIFLVEKTIFISGVGAVGGQYFHEELPISLAPLAIFTYFFKIGGFLSSSIFYLVWTGLVLIIVKLALSLGYIKKDNISKANLLNFLIIGITILFFMVVLRSPPQEVASEPRWYLPLAFSAFICISLICTTMIGWSKKYSKSVASTVSLIIIVLLVFNGYQQYELADTQVKGKTNSYTAIREAGIYMKSISNPEDLILTLGQPQMEYYSERGTLNARVWAADPKTMSIEEHFDATLKKIKESPAVRYIVITFTEPAYPDWVCNCGDISNADPVGRIPFMATSIDFSTGMQDIKQQISYKDITFTLVQVIPGSQPPDVVFIYEITRLDSSGN